MKQEQNDPYTAGYRAGFLDGIRDVINDRVSNILDRSSANLPVNVMTVSTHAKNCLTRAGCYYVADAAALDEETIIRIRYMGPKTALEIAQWMTFRGYAYTAWRLFL